LGLYEYYFVHLIKEQLALLETDQQHVAVETILNAANSYTQNGLILVIVLMLSLSITSFLCIRILVNLLHDMNTRLKAISQLGATRRDQLAVDPIPVISQDAIGEIAININQLVNYIQDLSLFRRTLEGDESVDDIYHRLIHVFRERLKLNTFAIWEITEGGSINPVLTYPAEIETETCQLNFAATCRAYRTGETVNSSRYPGICPVFPQTDTMTHCCVPMRVGGKILGIVQFLFMYVNSLERQRHFAYSLNLARQYLSEALPLLHAKHLHDLATRDALTGLYNRLFLESNINLLVAGIQRRSSTLGVLMCDMDQFKLVNDEYGHEAGDKVLIALANLLQSNIRASDLLVRYGGEEFLILLSDCHEDMAVQVAEKIREAVASHQFRYENITMRKTISIGISEFPTDNTHFWETVKYADVALYQAKETGRNKTIRFSPDMMKEE